MILRVTEEKKDAFSRWRARKAPRALVAAAQAVAPGQVYESIMVRRLWAALGTLVWACVVVWGIIVMAMNEWAIKQSIPYATGLMTLGCVLAFASLAMPLVINLVRRHWEVAGDHLLIRERPIVPFLGWYRTVDLRLTDIARAAIGEMLNGLRELEIQARDGRRFRIGEKIIRKDRTAWADVEGFSRFIAALEGAFAAAGLPRPPGGRMRTIWDGWLGIGLLAFILALTVAGCIGLLVFTVMAIDGRGLAMMALLLPLALRMTSLLRTKWRELRDGVA